MHVFTVQGDALSNSCLKICFAEACLGEFRLDNYNLMRSAFPSGCVSFIFVILLHTTARGEENWVLIK